MGTDSETHSRTLCRERKHISEWLCQIPSLQSSGKPAAEEMGVWEPEGMWIPGKQVSLNQPSNDLSEVIRSHRDGSSKRRAYMGLHQVLCL